MPRPLTPKGARLRDMILAHPTATYMELSALLAAEGYESIRPNMFTHARHALRAEGFEIPDIPKGQPSQLRNRPPLKPKKVPMVWPRDERKRCPTCGQVVKDP
jgi:hypothetical protein